MKLHQGTPEEVGMSSQRLQDVAAVAERWVDTQEMPPIVMMAARRGTIVFEKAIGPQTPDADSPPLQLDTLFPLASITKVVTATCAMMLVEQGLLDVIQPVQKYLPEFTGTHKETVRVWHLLTHTSGLRDEDVYAHVERKRQETHPPLPECPATQHPAIHEKLTLSYGTALWKEPGKQMCYCNTGYELVGEIVRRVSQQSLDTFAKASIFEPLGMKDTHLVVPQELWPRVVVYPDGLDRSTWMNDPKRREIPHAAGGLYSTVQDMAIFCQMYLNGGHYDGVRILSPTTIRYMTRDHLPGVSAVKGDEFFPEASWGIGWNIIGTKFDRGSLQSLQTYCHGGAGGVCIWIDPTYEVIGVYFSVGGTAQPSLYMNAINGAIIEI